MIYKKKRKPAGLWTSTFVFLLLICPRMTSTFFDDACPKYATFFEASNTTTDCNLARPISMVGLRGDKFCSNICSDDTEADTEKVFCVLKLWYFNWDPRRFDLKRFKCVKTMQAVPMTP